jgi:flagella synthesis protein FlgN
MDSNPQDLLAVLGEQIRCAEAMLATLARENRALVDSNPDELGTATAVKAEIVETLEKLEARRRTYAATLDAASAPGGAEWHRLRSLIAQCKEQNQRNGALLNARAEHLRAALKTLRGADLDLYGPEGRTPARAAARPLGTA